MLPQNWQFEIIKLVAQFTGALGIAWLTVRLALSRYKKEKTWERRLNAYIEIIEAVAALRRITGRTLEKKAKDLQFTEEFEESLGREYRAARHRLDQMIFVADLILSQESKRVIQTLIDKLTECREIDYWERDEYELAILQEHLPQLIDAGRRDLG